jgi:hypothetical protein
MLTGSQLIGLPSLALRLHAIDGAAALNPKEASSTILLFVLMPLKNTIR